MKNAHTVIFCTLVALIAHTHTFAVVPSNNVAKTLRKELDYDLANRCRSVDRATSFPQISARVLYAQQVPSKSKGIRCTNTVFKLSSRVVCDVGRVEVAWCHNADRLAKYVPSHPGEAPPVVHRCAPQRFVTLVRRHDLIDTVYPSP